MEWNDWVRFFRERKIVDDAEVIVASVERETNEGDLLIPLPPLDTD